MAHGAEESGTRAPTRDRGEPNGREGFLLPEYGTEIFRYRRVWTNLVISTNLVSLIPLIIMVIVNYYQYHKAFKEEVTRPIRVFTSNVQRPLRFFFHERHSVLDFVIHDKTADELKDQIRLTQIFHDLKNTHPDVVDLEVIDSNGKQRSYVGSYHLEDKDYSAGGTAGAGGEQRQERERRCEFYWLTTNQSWSSPCRSALSCAAMRWTP